MKLRNRWVVILTVLSLGTAACQRPSETGERASVVDTPASATEASVAGKWAMPAPMMVHIKALEADLQAFASAPEKDHAQLAAKIDGHAKQVMASCTMEGKAHEALHEWLMPFIQLTKDYAAAADAEKPAKLQAIQQSLADFHQRFE